MQISRICYINDMRSYHKHKLRVFGYLLTFAEQSADKRDIA